MKLITIIVLLLTSAAIASAQENKCTLKLSDLKKTPELYGFRIGMTLEQIKAIVPSLQPGNVDELGFSTTSFSPDFNPQVNKAVYKGVRTVSLEFLDGKLFMLWIGFDGSYKWKTLDELVRGMGAALGLPVGAWSVTSPKPVVECDDFEIAASMIAGAPSIRINDKTARDLWEQRRAEREEKRSEQESAEPR